MKCLICGDEKEKIFLCHVCLNFNSKYDLVECADCGVIFFQPLPSRAELELFYSASYYDFERHKNEGKGMAFARKYLRYKKTGKFLDIGCATGFFINGIRQNTDWEVYGVDFGKAAVNFAKETLKLNAFQGDVTELNFPSDYFDFIHINNVLEHVLNPVGVLKECRRMVKTDGIMYLSVPNGFVDSRDLIAFYRSEKQPARSKSGHIFFFPARTMLKILEETGFLIEKTHTYGIRRGLRSLGLYPRKGSWKSPYFPKKQTESGNQTAAVIEKKKHSDFYYRYRFAQLNLKMLRGLHKFGLDYQFILRPKIS